MRTHKEDSRPQHLKPQARRGRQRQVGRQRDDQNGNPPRTSRLLCTWSSVTRPAQHATAPHQGAASPIEVTSS